MIAESECSTCPFEILELLIVLFKLLLLNLRDYCFDEFMRVAPDVEKAFVCKVYLQWRFNLF